MNKEEEYMQRCLDLAVKGLGHVAPNPMVGCVIVHGDKIIGEGYHEEFGKAHAEVNAINSVKQQTLLEQSTIYVNLEPCSHFGKTPPCAGLIIEKKIPRVVIGSHDPNPEVGGKGITKLKEAGVKVLTGVLKKEADYLNRRFITFHTRYRPYIILKWAQSSDGIMAPAEPKQLWLTNDASRKLVHQWRSEEQAVLVGKNTMLIDKPKLTVRLVKGKNPVRITIDRSLSLPEDMKMPSSGAPLWIFNEKKDSSDSSFRFIKIDFNADVLPQILHCLANNQIQSLIVEGGPATLRHFIDNNLWDEARIFTTTYVLIKGKKGPKAEGKIAYEEMIERDKLSVILNTT